VPPLRLKGSPNLLRDEFFLDGNPFRTSQIYNPDSPGTYVREMYGKQLDEFHQKFFVLPLQKEQNRQVIGAVWSSHAGNSLGKGYGKSMLMAEESKLINQDFGGALLRQVGADPEDIGNYPFLAGYCTFKTASEIKSFPAALLEAVTFILSTEDEDGATAHQRLLDRLVARDDVDDAYPGESIRSLLWKELARYSGLSLQLRHKTVAGFIDRLCHDDTAALIQFIKSEIGPRIKASQGFNFVHIFNAFAGLAGIVYIAYFVDQEENFAKWARQQDRDVKILRESICQTSPTADMCSFIFQMHISAAQAIEDWWKNEHLPSLDYDKPINRTRVLDLKGLESIKEATALTSKYLQTARIDGAKVQNPLHPFSKEVIEAVLKATKGNPREFLETMGAILDQAVEQKERRIDLGFVEPLLADHDDSDEVPTDDEDFDNEER
jgi:hypothetical protein